VKGTKTQISKTEGRKSKNPVWRRNSRGPGKGECKRNKNDGEILMWERGERKQILDGRRGKKMQNVILGERERKKRGEILNEDGMEIGWMKEVGYRKKNVSLDKTVCRNRKARRPNNIL
jgi:hypothetical protein